MKQEQLNKLIAEYQALCDGGNVAAHGAVCELKAISAVKTDVGWLRNRYVAVGKMQSGLHTDEGREFFRKRKEYRLEALKKMADMMEEEK